MDAYTGKFERSKQNGLGIVANFLGSAIPGLSEAIGTGLGASGNLAKSIGNAVMQGGVGIGSNLAGGKSFGDSLKAGAVGGLSGLASGVVGNYLGGAVNAGLKDSLGGDLSKIFAKGIGAGAGNLTGGALRGLASGSGDVGDMVKASGIAALTGGLGAAGGGALNELFNPNNDAERRQEFNKLATSVAGLAPKIRNQRKQEEVQERNQQLQQAYLNKFKQQMSARV